MFVMLWNLSPSVISHLIFTQCFFFFISGLKSKNNLRGYVHRRSFCDELCQLYDVIYETRCPTVFHTERHQSSFIGNFHIFCHRNENDNGFVVFCGDLSFHWYIGR